MRSNGEFLTHAKERLARLARDAGDADGRWEWRHLGDGERVWGRRVVRLTVFGEDGMIRNVLELTDEDGGDPPPSRGTLRIWAREFCGLSEAEAAEVVPEPLGGEGYYTWTVEVAVHPVWVADGFNLTEERLHGILQRTLDFATSGEVAGRVISAPDPEEIRAEQGYRSSRAPRLCPRCDRLGTVERDGGGEVYCTGCGWPSEAS